jgi:hypothetical protein
LFTNQFILVLTSHYLCIKVKHTLVQALRLCTGRPAHTGSRDVALPFHDHCIRIGWWVSVTVPAALYHRKKPVPIVQEAVWATETVWTGVENIAPTGIRSPDRPACSQSLYRLSYPGPSHIYFFFNLACKYPQGKRVKERVQNVKLFGKT